SRDDFARRWKAVEMQVLVGPEGPEGDPPYTPLRLWWPLLPVDLASDEVNDPVLRTKLFNFYEFVRRVPELDRRLSWPIDELAIVEQLWNKPNSLLHPRGMRGQLAPDPPGTIGGERLRAIHFLSKMPEESPARQAARETAAPTNYVSEDT